MGNQNKIFAFLWNPTRLTIGVAWEFYKSDIAWSFELSIQIPVVALSVLINNETWPFKDK